MIDTSSERGNYAVPALLLTVLALAFWAVEDRPADSNEVPLPASMTIDSRLPVVDGMPLEPRRMTVATTSSTAPKSDRVNTDTTSAQRLGAMPTLGQADDQPTRVPNVPIKQATPKP